MASDLYVHLFSCERVAWGKFERPLSFMLEYTNKAAAPAQCKEGSYDFMNSLHWGIVNDADFVEFLRTNYEAPFEFGNVSYTLDTSNGIQTIAWTWSTKGSLPSSLTTTSSDYQRGTANVVDRIAWNRGDGLVMLDLTENYISTGVRGQVGTGQMNPPMLYYAATKQNQYASQAEIFFDDETTATIQLFGDSKCEQPL